MNSSCYLLTFYVVVLLGLSQEGVSGCKNCTSEGIIFIQDKCKTEDSNLINEQKDFEVHNNKTKFCSALFEVFFCVGRNIPECVDRVTSMYAMYYSSPYDCHPDEDTNLKLQEYSHSVVCGSSTVQSTAAATAITAAPKEMTSFAVTVTPNKNVGTNSAKKSTNTDIPAMALMVIGQLLYIKLRSTLT